jgi:two-component system nitrate/nitrite response regulator NarL
MGRPVGGNGPPRVVVYARHTVLGEALCHALEGAGYRARHLRTRSPVAVASLLRSVSPDVVVVGAEADDDQFERMALIADLVDAGIPVIGLTGHSDNVFGRQLLRRAGAAAVVGSRDSLTRFVAVVNAVHEGTSELGREPEVEELTSAELSRQEYTERLQLLSARERLILDELRRGRTVREIAHKDVVAESTVRAQVASILRKLGVSSQLAAVAVLHWTFDPHPSGAGAAERLGP